MYRRRASAYAVCGQAGDLHPGACGIAGWHDRQTRCHGGWCPVGCSHNPQAGSPIPAAWLITSSPWSCHGRAFRPIRWSPSVGATHVHAAVAVVTGPSHKWAHMSNLVADALPWGLGHSQARHMCPVRLMVVDRVMYSWVCNAGPKCLGCTDFSILRSIFDRSVYEMIASLDCDPYCSRKVLSSTLR